MIENFEVPSGLILGSTYLERIHRKVRQLVLNEESLIVFPNLDTLLVTNGENLVVTRI